LAGDVQFTKIPLASKYCPVYVNLQIFGFGKAIDWKAEDIAMFSES